MDTDVGKKGAATEPANASSKPCNTLHQAKKIRSGANQDTVLVRIETLIQVVEPVETSANVTNVC